MRHGLRPFNQFVADVEVEEPSGETVDDETCHPCENDEESGERFVRKMQSPLLPTPAEIESHNLTHFP